MIFFARCLLTCYMISLFPACQNKEKPVEKEAQTRDTAVVKSEALNPYAPTDISPMDISYYPVDYPLLKMTGKINMPPVARVIYSRPHRQGRQIFGSVLKYGEAWRLGANEATEIEFFRNVIIQGKRIRAGRYIIYCIPLQDEWTLILNTNINTWGLKIDPGKDLHRFDVPSLQTDSDIEFFTMIFEKTDKGADLVITWDNIIARLPVEFNL